MFYMFEKVFGREINKNTSIFKLFVMFEEIEKDPEFNERNTKNKKKRYR